MESETEKVCERDLDLEGVGHEEEVLDCDTDKEGV